MLKKYIMLGVINHRMTIVSLLDLITGVDLYHTERYNVECKDCQNVRCTQCNGKGTTAVLNHILLKAICDLCKGKKYIPLNHCETCAGTEINSVEETFQYRVEPGTHNGDIINLRGKINLSMHIQIAETPLLRRSKVRPEDLKTRCKISLLEVLCGFSRTITSIDGKTTNFVSGGVMTNTKFRIQGFGLPIKNNIGRRGDLIVKFEVTYPENLTDDQKTKLRDILST